MTGKSSRVPLGAGFLCLLMLGWVLSGQAAKLAQQGMPTDWTHRHVIFSQPATAMQAGFLANEPRFWQQEIRRRVTRVVSGPGVAGAAAMPELRFGNLTPSAKHADWSENLGSGGSVGADNYPAKFSFQVTSANCASVTTPDFVVFGTGLLGGGGQASIVGYDNLYSGCSGTVPSTYWAYNTGGVVTTSPVLSSDGSQVAFVQTNGFLVATLVLLKWKMSTSESVTSPGTPASPPLNMYSACTAPCMAQIPLVAAGTPTGDTTSSVFYDYSLDTAWVGDSLGYLHKFHPVFAGTPAEITTSPWPVQVNPANPDLPLSSPVHDLVSDNVYVGDVGGFVYRVSASTGAVTKSGKIDSGVGIVAGPVVDSTAQKLYVFASSDGSSACGGSPCSAFYVFGTAFASGNTGTKVTVGTAGASPSPLYEGGFDGNYLASSNATGDVFICGNTGGAPIVYRIAINAGVPGAAVAGPTLASAATGCSPVADIANPNAIAGGTEWIFASVQNSGSGNSCSSGGCVMNFVNQPWKPNTTYAVGQQVLDTHFQIQTVRVAGISSATTHGWSTVIGGSTGDNTVRWRNQGPQVAAHAAWLPSTSYKLPNEILDTNGNIQLAITAGTSKAGTHPTWMTTVDAITTDGTVHWRNVGALATFSLAAAGGTSGIIMDNIVSTGTLAGVSQVYFSTQSDQACATGGTGGCAVQASQSALK